MPRKHSLHAYSVTVSGCWEWHGSRNLGGYPQGSFPNATSSLAHRWHYEQSGRKIPEGMQLDHLCRNRGCVNPEHLEPVTNRENRRRGVGTRLTDLQVEAIKNVPRVRGSSRVLAEKYGVHESTISAIRTGRNWSDIGGQGGGQE